jgi:methylaspartate mutase epsilon subunit
MNGRSALRQPPRSFGAFVAAARSRKELVVQPRMGISDPAGMRAGLHAVKGAGVATVGTITLDSYTRLGDHRAARAALAEGAELNGYPLVAHRARTTRALLDGVRDDDFPVQVRHGSARPLRIFRTVIRSGVDACEGGPVSYCLPYGRTPLRESLRSWSASCTLFARGRDAGLEPHLETFGGCMLGQLCPPGLLVAISLLEGMFFWQHGLRSISLSYAQQTDAAQDEEAIRALTHLAAEYLPYADTHVVVYTYMGVYPRTRPGARLLSQTAARIAVRAGAARLIVKTTAEAYRIPTVGENVEALRDAATAAAAASRTDGPAPTDSETYQEARALLDAVLELDDRVGPALLRAFRLGYLDVPYCLHPDNRGDTLSYIDADGRLRWARTGAMPIRRTPGTRGSSGVSSHELLAALSHVQRTFDRRALAAVGTCPDGGLGLPSEGRTR